MCLISQHMIVQGLSIHVDVHVGFTFGADGMDVARLTNGLNGTFGAGGGNVQATLHFPTAVSSSANEDITFSHPDDTTITSPSTGKEYLMKCKRT